MTAGQDEARARAVKVLTPVAHCDIDGSAYVQMRDAVDVFAAALSEARDQGARDRDAQIVEACRQKGNGGVPFITELTAKLPLPSAGPDIFAESAKNAPALAPLREADDAVYLHGFLGVLMGWQAETFGPRQTLAGLKNHFDKEWAEVEENPTDLKEWLGLLNLVLSGARLHGHSAADVSLAWQALLTELMGRTWPDWRLADPDRAIEHDRGARCDICGGEDVLWGLDGVSVPCPACAALSSAQGSTTEGRK